MSVQIIYTYAYLVTIIHADFKRKFYPLLLSEIPGAIKHCMTVHLLIVDGLVTVVLKYFKSVLQVYIGEVLHWSRPKSIKETTPLSFPQDWDYRNLYVEVIPVFPGAVYHLRNLLESWILNSSKVGRPLMLTVVSMAFRIAAYLALDPRKYKTSNLNTRLFIWGRWILQLGRVDSICHLSIEEVKFLGKLLSKFNRPYLYS